jgi:hypothetical protein
MLLTPFMITFVDTCYVRHPNHTGSRKYIPRSARVRITPKFNEHIESLLEQELLLTPLIKSELDIYHDNVQREIPRHSISYRNLLEEYDGLLTTFLENVNVVQPSAQASNLITRFPDGKPSSADRELLSTAAVHGLNEPSTLHTRDRDFLTMTEYMVKYDLVPWTNLRVCWDRAWYEELVYGDKTRFS